MTEAEKIHRRNTWTYEQAAHAMQSGVRVNQETCGSLDGSPKHLRTGINSCLSDGAAVARLLIAKGTFTEAEYLEAIRLQMVLEVERYEAVLTAKLGNKISLA